MFFNKWITYYECTILFVITKHFKSEHLFKCIFLIFLIVLYAVCQWLRLTAQVTLAGPIVGGRQTDRPWGESLDMES